MLCAHREMTMLGMTGIGKKPHQGREAEECPARQGTRRTGQSDCTNIRCGAAVAEATQYIIIVSNRSVQGLSLCWHNPNADSKWKVTGLLRPSR